MIAAIAPVAELVDAPDSKSGDGNIVLVRSRPGAPAFAATRLRLASHRSALSATAFAFAFGLLLPSVATSRSSLPGLIRHR
jgi:hypothetical protein